MRRVDWLDEAAEVFPEELPSDSSSAVGKVDDTENHQGIEINTKWSALLAVSQRILMTNIHYLDRRIEAGCFASFFDIYPSVSIVAIYLSQVHFNFLIHMNLGNAIVFTDIEWDSILYST